MPLKFLLQPDSDVIISKLFNRLVIISKEEAVVLKVIPVIDVLGGVVVHAIRGRRKDYRALESVLCKSIDPLHVAISFNEFGFSELYLADLDAITGGLPSFSLFKRIARHTNLEMMVDAGVTNLIRTRELLGSGVSQIIIGTETLLKTEFIAEAVEILGSQKVIVSLDLMDNRVISGFRPSKFMNPLTFLSELERMGVSQIIMLDLTRVGSREGINLTFLTEVLDNIEAKVIVGGGVRDIKDLMELKDLGVYGALVATALHSGEISVGNLKEIGLL